MGGYRDDTSELLFYTHFGEGVPDGLIRGGGRTKEERVPERRRDSITRILYRTRVLVPKSRRKNTDEGPSQAFQVSPYHGRGIQ